MTAPTTLNRAARDAAQVRPASAPRAPEGRRANRSRDSLARPGVWVRYAVMLLAFVIAVGPLLWQLSTSLKGPAADIYSEPPQLWPVDATLRNYGRVAQIIPVWQFGVNSLIVAALTVIGNLIGATCAGYAMATMRFRGRRLVLGAVMAGILVPAEVILIARFLQMQSLGLTDTLLGVVLPTAVNALNVLLMYNAFLGLPPAIEEAAMLDGANAWQRFRRIAVPSVKGTMTVVAIFSFVGAWNDFLWPLVVLSDQSKYTLTVGMNFLQGTFTNDPRVVAAGTVIAIAPLLILFFALQRYFFRGVGEGGIKG